MDAKGGFSIGMGDRTDITEIDREVDNPGPARYRNVFEVFSDYENIYHVFIYGFLYYGLFAYIPKLFFFLNLLNFNEIDKNDLSKKLNQMNSSLNNSIISKHTSFRGDFYNLVNRS